MSPFEVVYGFNPLTPLDLAPLPLSSVTCVDGMSRAEMVRKLHEKVKNQIEKRNQDYARRANKGRKRVSFEPGEWVWLHLRKERFPQARKSKLAPRGDGPFQVLKKIGENAYSLDLPHEKYNVHGTFNVADLSPFVGYEDHEEVEAEMQDMDPRSDPLQEGEDDEEHLPKAPRPSVPKPTKPYQEDKALAPLQGLGGPMTRSRAKRAQTLLLTIVQGWISQESGKEGTEAASENKREGYALVHTLGAPVHTQAPPRVFSCATLHIGPKEAASKWDPSPHLK